MKKITLIVFLVCNFFSSANEQFFNDADQLFSTFVINGKVNYKAVKGQHKLINSLIDHLATSPYTPEEEKAYLINAYNIFVIYQVVENYGRIKSPTDLTDFFNGKNLVLNNELTSLDIIENEILRKKYEDPRIHFALVCGANGCPPITTFAYRPELLEEQLNNQTKSSLNNDRFVYQIESEKTIYLSQIFEWFQQDFGKNQKAIVAFINNHRENDFNVDYKVRFYDYDWTLNDTDTPISLGGQSVPIKKQPIQKLEANPTNTEGDLGMPSETEITETKEIGVDTVINLQTFTAGSLLRHKQMDFTLFNTLYTETKGNWLGNENTGYRASFITHLFQFTYGITKSRRLNAGLDLNFKLSANNSSDEFSGAFRPYSFQNNDSTRVGLTSVGIRLKYQLFKEVKDFSIQSTFYIPTIKNPEGFFDPTGANSLYWADWDRYIWWNQFFYSKTIRKFQIFAEADLLFRFRRYESQIGMLDIPLNLFVSYFPTNKITFYAMTQHVARLTNNITPQNPIVTDWVVPMNYTASGFGFKYNIQPRLNVELLYTNFWRGTNTGLGSTFNIGIKYLTK